MRDVRAVVGGAVAAGICIVIAATVLSARDAGSGRRPASTERFLYLRSAEKADQVFLTFDALAADVYWIRTIQHYGRDRKSIRQDGRFELLQPLLDLTTSLDPRFNIAYRFGAIFLSLDPPNGPGRTDQAIALLEKGLAVSPDRWQYAHDIGFIHYWHTGNYAEAARWFERAAGVPSAPEWLRPLAAVTLAEGGDRSGARQLLTDLLASDEPYVRQAAERALAQLQALDVIDALQALVDRFRETAGRYPASWLDLIQSGLLPGMPVDAARTPFVYDPVDRRVSLSPESPLAPLPRGLNRR